MKRTAWIANLILMLAAMLMAQTATSSGGTQSSAPASSTAAGISLSGCLAAPNDKGNYVLKAAREVKIELLTTASVSTDALKPHVGHTVSVMGTWGGQPTAKPRPFKVNKITMKSATCAPAAPARTP